MPLKIFTPYFVTFSLFYIILSINPTLVSAQDKGDPLEISFQSNSGTLYGWFYKSKGTVPLSTIILLQGSRGNDGDMLNLGKGLSNEGYNVMTYNYPGAWRSEGFRTNNVALSSVQDAINFLKSENVIRNYRIDTTDIILLGYSYGGGMALLGAVKDPSISKVISIAGLDLSVFANALEKNPEFRKSHEQYIDNLFSNPLVARAPSGAEIHNSIIQSKDKYDLKKYAEELAGKEVLLIGGWQDLDARIEEYVLPLYRAIRKINPAKVSIVALDTNHYFSNVQEELTEAIVRWLQN